MIGRRLPRRARLTCCAQTALRLTYLIALAAISPISLSADDWVRKPLRGSSTSVFRAQSPGYDNQYEITGGNPAPAPGGYSNPSVSNSAIGQTGQMPIGRTGPDSQTGFSGNSPRYPASGFGAGNPGPGYGGTSTPGRTVQYGSPSGQTPAPGPQSPYPPGAYPPQGFAPPAYPPGGNPPGSFSPNVSPPPGTLSSPSPFAPPSGGGPGSDGNLGPGARPNMLSPGPDPAGLNGAPGGGAGPPPLGGYDSQGNLLSPDSPFNQPPLPVPITVGVQETTTGRLNFGVGVNSNAGLIGNIVIDEQNFDWRKLPTSWDDIKSQRAFRGAGQQFRIEAMPGTLLSRYGFTFREPYLWDTRINFGIDGYYFNRYFQNWTEQRAGGRVSFGYQLTPDLSTSLALKAENVGIFNPTVPTPPELTDVLGHSTLLVASWTTVHDTRDSPFLPTQGHRISLDLEQGFGTFSFPRAIVGLRQHFKLYERPDGSGRHVLNLLSDVGFTGTHTPIFENFFAGGYNTIRGFYYRGASPLDMGVQVGGKFEFLNTAEYMFPLTASDALRGVVFTDFGTVEPSTELKWQDFRIAPGFGLRVTIPAMGPAPIALDFAFPVHKSPGDRLQVFNFFVGLQR